MILHYLNPIIAVIQLTTLLFIKGKIMRKMSGDRGTWNGDFVQKLKISRKSNHNIK